jgi:hypothetical protein
MQPTLLLYALGGKIENRLLKPSWHVEGRLTALVRRI